MEKREIINLMGLKKMKGLGNSRIIKLVNYAGKPSKLATNSISIKAIDNNLYNYIKELGNIKLGEFYKIYNECMKNGIKITTYFDESYPDKLKCIRSPPLMLFSKGDFNLLKNPSIAIVGSRKSDKRSLEWAYKLSKELAEKGYIVVSGGARGIDTAAHLGALDAGGKTVSVMVSGFEDYYPKENIKLFNEIGKKGLLLTEYYPRQNVNKLFSPLERNRIISGIADYVVVVTTDLKGGAMSQFELAKEQHRIVFCPKKELGLKPDKGTAKILDKKEAMPIEDSKDILNYTNSNKLYQQIKLS